MKSRIAGLWRTHRVTVLVVCTLAAGALIVAVIWPITDLIAAHDVGTITGSQRAFHLETAREAARTQLFTLGAGLFALGALVYTARNFTLARHQLDLSRRAMELTEQGQRRTLELTEQGQVTERYTRTIEQLGSDKPDVRIGGIYALELVALDSPRDHPTVIEVLAAFIREHSPEPADGPGRRYEPESDVQAALTVIGRRDTEQDRGIIDLGSAWLTGANLTGANLARANLVNTELTFAIFTDANLTGANLASTNLITARLRRANLTGADLSDADLTRADLTGADLTGADLSRAGFAQANLTEAKLTKANLTGADFTDALWSEGFPAPAGWAVNPSSGRLCRANAVDSD